MKVIGKIPQGFHPEIHDDTIYIPNWIIEYWKRELNPVYLLTTSRMELAVISQILTEYEPDYYPQFLQHHTLIYKGMRWLISWRYPLLKHAFKSKKPTEYLNVVKVAYAPLYYRRRPLLLAFPHEDGSFILQPANLGSKDVRLFQIFVAQREIG